MKGVQKRVCERQLEVGMKTSLPFSSFNACSPRATLASSIIAKSLLRCRSVNAARVCKQGKLRMNCLAPSVMVLQWPSPTQALPALALLLRRTL